MIQSQSLGVVFIFVRLIALKKCWYQHSCRPHLVKRYFLLKKVVWQFLNTKYDSKWRSSYFRGNYELFIRQYNVYRIVIFLVRHSLTNKGIFIKVESSRIFLWIWCLITKKTVLLDSQSQQIEYLRNIRILKINSNC